MPLTFLYTVFINYGDTHMIQYIDINTYQGSIPNAHEMVEFEANSDPIEDGIVLYGFDEVGMGGFKDPQHAFVPFSMVELGC